MRRRSSLTEADQRRHGRVVFDVDASTSVILYGPATSRKPQGLIAKRLGLVKWRAELDPHYSTGRETEGVVCGGGLICMPVENRKSLAPTVFGRT